MSFKPDVPKAASASAPKLPYSTIKKRADFLAFGRNAHKFSCPFFMMMLRKRPQPDAASNNAEPAVIAQDAVRIGYTVSKKVSKKAVTRNRIKRRLRESVRITLPAGGHPGYDYVIVARRASEGADFHALTERLRFALKWLHKQA